MASDQAVPELAIGSKYPYNYLVNDTLRVDSHVCLAWRASGIQELSHGKVLGNST